MIGIYLIKNLVNGKIYIGKSKDINRRIKEHKRRSNSKMDKFKNHRLYNAISKYGIESFNFEVLEECEEKLLDKKEREYIKRFKSFDKRVGYNNTEGGERGDTFSNRSEQSQIKTRQLLREKSILNPSGLKREIWLKKNKKGIRRILGKKAFFQPQERRWSMSDCLNTVT